MANERNRNDNQTSGPDEDPRTDMNEERVRGGGEDARSLADDADDEEFDAADDLDDDEEGDGSF